MGNCLSRPETATTGRCFLLLLHTEEMQPDTEHSAPQGSCRCTQKCNASYLLVWFMRLPVQSTALGLFQMKCIKTFNLHNSFGIFTSTGEHGLWMDLNIISMFSVFHIRVFIFIFSLTDQSASQYLQLCHVPMFFHTCHLPEKNDWVCDTSNGLFDTSFSGPCWAWSINTYSLFWCKLEEARRDKMLFGRLCAISPPEMHTYFIRALRCHKPNAKGPLIWVLASWFISSSLGGGGLSHPNPLLSIPS